MEQALVNQVWHIIMAKKRQEKAAGMYKSRCSWKDHLGKRMAFLFEFKKGWHSP